MVLTMIASSSASAAYYLYGPFGGSSDWINVPMTDNGDGTVSCEQAMTSGQKFLIRYDNGSGDYNYLKGSYENDWLDVLPKTLYLSTSNPNDITIVLTGTFVLTLNTSNNQLTVKYKPGTITNTHTGTGTVGVASQASGGETVTITATPGDGYYVNKSNVTAEVTSPTGGAQAPAKAPAVGEFLTISGDELNHTTAAQYTFTMPDNGLGVRVNVDYQERVPITLGMITPIGTQDHTGSAIEPGAVITDGNYTLVEGEDYEIVYSNNVNAGTATATITGIGKYTGTVPVEFTIQKVAHSVTVAATTNGTVTASPTSALEGATITLTVTPAPGYELGTLTATYGDNQQITITNNTFEMPDANVTVNATFTKIPVLYLVGGFTNWNDATQRIAMTKNANGDWVTTATLGAGASDNSDNQFKFVLEGDDTRWIGPVTDGGNFQVLSDYIINGTELSLQTGGQNFYIPVAGEWTFTVKNIGTENEKLVISGTYPFNVTVNAGQNGTAVLTGGTTSGTYRNGETVSVTVTPNANYLVTFQATYGSGQSITPTINGNVYTFTMPAGDVTVNVTFTHDPKMYIVGSFNSWIPLDETNGRMTRNTETGVFTITKTLDANVEFKLMDQDQLWLGAASSNAQNTYNEDVYKVSGEEIVNATPFTLNNTGAGKNFLIPKAGTWTFTYNPNGYLLTITGDWLFDITETHTNITGAAVTLNKSTAAKDEVVTVTVTPVAGYTYAITATGDVTLTQDANNENVYTFTVGSKDVNVDVVYTKVPKVYLIGGFNGWNQSLETVGENGPMIELTKDASGNYVTTQTWTEEMQFKFMNENYNNGSNDASDKWIGAVADAGTSFDVTSQYIGVELSLTNPGENFKIPAGTWQLIVNEARTKLTINGTWQYNITKTVNNGAATVDKEVAAENEVVTVTIGQPEEGYEFGSITVMAGENAVTTTTVTAGEEYTFVMPAADVNVTVNFTKIPTLVLTGSFTDWDNNAISFTKDAGTGNWVLANVEIDANAEFGFKDENGIWYAGAVNDEGTKFQITQALLGNPITMGSQNEGKNFYFPVAGKWTFTVSADKSTVTVTGAWDYAVNVATGIQNGTVAVNKNRASAKESVVVTVTPDSDWSIGEVFYTDANNNVVAINKNGEDVYAFEMPYSDVTVSATFSKSQYTITLNPSSLAAVSVDKNVANSGVDITVTVTPNTTADFKATGLTVTRATAGPAVEVTDNGDGTFTFAMPTSNVTVDAVVEAILHGVAFDAQRQWATYFGAYDIQAPENTQVYVVTGLNPAGDEVTVEEISYIPANTGVLLFSETAADNITAPLFTGTTGSYTSTLVGSVEGMNISSGYLLHNNVFLRAQAGELDAHRCYLPEAPAAGGAPARINIPGANVGNVLTDVDDIKAQGNVASVKYVNLRGQVSERPFEGVNIIVTTFTDGSVKTVKVIK